MNRFVYLAPTQLRLNWLKLLGGKKSIWAKSVPSVLLPTWRNVLIPQPFHRFKSVWNIQDQRFSHSSSGWSLVHFQVVEGKICDLAHQDQRCAHGTFTSSIQVWQSIQFTGGSEGSHSSSLVHSLFLSLRGQAALSMHSFFIINNSVHLLGIFHTVHTSKKVADVPMRQQTRLHC